ncbi:MAG: dodecin family protein [Candidatus Nitrosopolaris sp.]
MSVAKIAELVGSSEKGWEDAAQTAVKGATKTIRGIHGIEVKDITAKIDSQTGKIQEDRVGIKLSFGIER